MDKIELPPLPEPAIKTAHPAANAFAYGYHADQLTAYARAALAPVVAERDEAIAQRNQTLIELSREMARAEKAEAELSALKEAVRGLEEFCIARASEQITGSKFSEYRCGKKMAYEFCADELAALNITKEQP